MPFHTITAKTIKYLAVPSVVGHEHHFQSYLADDFKNLGLDVIFHNGVLEVNGKAPYSNIISAHMDRHGLISIGNGQYAYAAEYVREVKYGERNNPTNATLNAIRQRFIGERVYAYDPETGDRLGEGAIETAGLAADHLDSLFSIQGMRPVAKDIPVAYARKAESDGPFLIGQIDNVISLGVIYTLFQNGYQGTALLTFEEEIGKSWIHLKSWLDQKKLEAKNLIIIDTSPYRERAPVEAGMVVLRYRDKSAAFNHHLVTAIQKRAEELLIPYQFKDEYFLALGLETKDLGSTELGRLVQQTDGLYSGATIQIPTIEYHTSFETTSRSCIDNYFRLLHDILVRRMIDPA